MQLNLNLEEYNIQMDIRELYRSFQEYQRQCYVLESLGEMIKQKIIQAKDQFTTANYDRSVNAVNSYLRKLSAMRQELDELMRSCNQLAEKMEYIERPW